MQPNPFHWVAALPRQRRHEPVHIANHANAADAPMATAAIEASGPKAPPVMKAGPESGATIRPVYCPPETAAPKIRPFHKVPAEVQADRQPQGTGCDVGQSHQRAALQGNRQCRHPRGAMVTGMHERKCGSREDQGDRRSRAGLPAALHCHDQGRDQRASRTPELEDISRLKRCR